MSGRDHPRSRGALVAAAVAVALLLAYAVAREARRGPVSTRHVPALGVIDRCESCHDGARHPGPWLAAHPPERFACTPCHGGQGLATTAAEAHGRGTGWERPLFTRLEREAACGRCHLAPTVDGAPLLVRGRQALAERGCGGCHELAGSGEREVAADLDGLRDKVDVAWVRGWLSSPEAFPHRTMPRFRLDAAQVEQLVAFLFSLDGPQVAAPPARVRGDARRGELAVARRRCATCHRIGEAGGLRGPALDLAGAKLRTAWLARHLAATHRLRPGTRMPAFRLGAQEAADIAAHARAAWRPAAPLPWASARQDAPAEDAGPGRQLFAELGCRGCHRVKGMPLRRPPVPLHGLGGRPIVDLPASRTLGAPADAPEYCAQRAAAPDSFPGPRSLMPSYDFPAEEARAIGVAIASLSGRPPAAYVRAAPSPPRAPGGAVGALLERFRCLVCHRIQGTGGAVARVPLDGAGSRLRRTWIARFLQSPWTVRPDQAERMPALGLDAREAARLADWMDASLADERSASWPRPAGAPAEDGRRLYGERRCADCHVAEGRGTTGGPVLDLARDRLKPAYVLALLRAGRSVAPDQRHPPELLARQEAEAIASYVSSLGPAPAPPVAPPVRPRGASGPSRRDRTAEGPRPRRDGGTRSTASLLRE